VTREPRGVLPCAVTPRDLGLDQGHAARGAVREAVAALPRAVRLGLPLPRLGGDPLAARSARDARSHFPHMSERLAGLARGARVPRAALEALLARELGAGGAASGGALGLAAAPERTGGRVLLGRTLPVAASGGGPPWIVRRSAPEHDWRSVELAAPWLVPALAGVNERGLAVAALGFPPAAGSLAACAAPALLLAQDCLQRWDSAEKAIEWCERRPAGGSAALLFADASGDLALVEVEGPGRRVARGRDGVLAATGAAARAAELEKSCAAEAVLDETSLAALLAAGAEAAVVLDCGERCLAVGGVRHPVAPPE
jgi:hypothetical protein